MSALTKGYIHFYTGNGKGKTTAAIGLAVRAAGFGLKTYFVQFMKDFPYNEVKALERLKEQITIKQFGNDAFVFSKTPPTENDKKMFRDGYSAAMDAMKSGKYDLIVLDEIFVCTYFDLCTAKEIESFLNEKPSNVELVLTGRYCPESLYAYADLITEMKEEKHYYQNGVLSRKGIDC